MATRLVRYAGWVSGIGSIFALTMALVYGDSLPTGQVLSPRLGEIDVTGNQTIRFGGWVDFPGSSGLIKIFVKTKSPLGAFSWHQVGTATPSSTGTDVGGQTRYVWTYSALKSDLFNGETWPEGGTARVKFLATSFTRGNRLLPVYDGNMIPGNNEELVLADRAPTPADLPPDQSPDYLNKKPREPDTLRYYLSVGTDYQGGGAPIWLSLPTLDAFKRRYFDQAASCSLSRRPAIQATYFNQGDLGVGREMHCVRNECTKETACYVKNYGNPDGTPIFGRMDKASESLLANKPFATVAMVERGAMATGADNKVFFAVYDNQKLAQPQNPDSALLRLDAPLDNKAYNKSIPGNCLVCHGIGSRYTPSSKTAFDARVTGAYFLPFDLQSFDFFSTSTSNPLSRTMQEAAFKGLNRLVYFTDLYFNLDARELIEGWYGGAYWPLNTFMANFVPSGWRNPSSATDDAKRKQLYLNVVARSCRTCHITHVDNDDPSVPSPLTFGSFQQLSDLAAVAYTDICVTHAMPNAEQALKQFWASPARAHFLNRLSLPNECHVTPRPGPTSATVSAISTAAVVDRFTSDSCSCTTRDCLKTVDQQYLRDLPETSLVAGSEPAIAGMLDTARQCRDRILQPGRGSGSTTPLRPPAQLLLEQELEREERLNRTP